MGIKTWWNSISTRGGGREGNRKVFKQVYGLKSNYKAEKKSLCMVVRTGHLGKVVSNNKNKLHQNTYVQRLFLGSVNRRDALLSLSEFIIDVLGRFVCW